VLAGRDQVFDDAWMKRLGVNRKDFGIGMKTRRGQRSHPSINSTRFVSTATRWASARASSRQLSAPGLEGQVQPSAVELPPPPRAPFRRRWRRPSRAGRGWRC